MPAGQNRLLAWPEVERRLLFLTYLGLCTTALVQAGKLWILKRGAVEVWYRGVVVSWLLVPVVLAFCISVLKPIFITYYLIICVPPLVLLAALGIDGISRRWMRVALLVIVAGLAAGTVAVYYRYESKEDWRSATRYVLAHAQPRDIITFSSGNRRLFKYYVDHAAGPTLQVPRVVDLFDDTFGQHGTVMSSSTRIWLVLCHDKAIKRSAGEAVGTDTVGDRIQASLARSRSLVREGTFKDIRVLLYGPPRRQMRTGLNG